MLPSPQDIDQFAAYAKQKLCREQSELSLDQLYAQWRDEQVQQASRELDFNHSRIEALLRDLHADTCHGPTCEAFVEKVRDELVTQL